MSSGCSEVIRGGFAYAERSICTNVTVHLCPFYFCYSVCPQERVSCSVNWNSFSTNTKWEFLFIFINRTKGFRCQSFGFLWKKTLLCRMTNKQNTCSYKLLNAFSSTHKRWVLVTFQEPYVTKLVKKVAVAVQISAWQAQGNVLPLNCISICLCVPRCHPLEQYC